MDVIQSLVDLARAAALLRAQSGLSALRNQEALPVGRQGVRPAIMHFRVILEIRGV